jgi:transposase
MAAELLPESLWEEIQPLLPPRPPPSSKGGRPPVDDRAALRGILYVDRYGVPWQALPTAAFGVSGSSCWRRLRDWTKAGIWPTLHRRLLNRLGRAGGVDLDRVAVDSQSVRAKKGVRTPARTRRTAGNGAASGTCWSTPTTSRWSSGPGRRT